MTRKSRKPTQQRSPGARRASRERELQSVYDEIPRIPDCTGACAEACGPIVMYGLEWERVKRSARRTPKMKGWTCPMLSPTGKCTVYTVRPYICRLWGTTPQLKCPHGCQPEHWLSTEQAHALFERIRLIAGPEVIGPGGTASDLWEAIGLEAREARESLIEQAKERLRAQQDAV